MCIRDRADLDGIYPDFVNVHLREALRRFDRKMKGFITEDALFVGPETRTSSPLRIERCDETLQAIGLEMLYPCGEGSGYGGGIVSAAIDGLRVAQRILGELS